MSKLDAVGSSIKVQILQNAMLHSEAGAFDFFISDNHTRQSSSTKSTVFAAEVLRSFMQGLGHRVPVEYTAGPVDQQVLYGRAETEEQKAARQLAFREQLGTQIHRLTGQKPRWAVQTDGSHAIFQV